MTLKGDESPDLRCSFKQVLENTLNKPAIFSSSTLSELRY
jgi:hypothetical protein